MVDYLATRKDKKSLRNRMIITILFASGIRVSGLVGLRLRDIKPHNIESVEPLYYLVVYAGTPEQYFALLTPKASRLIDDYCKVAHKHSKPETELIDITPIRCSNMIAETMKAVGIERNKSGRRYDIMPAHVLRKLCNTIMIESGVSRAYKERLLGHSQELDDVYWRPDASMLLQGTAETPGYERAIPNLTL